MQNYQNRISVIIPLYNHEHYITQALESVYSQTAKPKEVIVLDDGSQDKSLDIVRKFAKTCPDMIVGTHPNQGAHYTINTGIKQASGEFVSILNSDDAYHPDRFARCLAQFDADPGLSAICTGLSFMDHKGKSIQNPWHQQARSFYDQVNDLSLALINGNFFMTTSNLIVRRTVFDEIGYFSALRYTHDLDFFLRLLLHEKRIAFYDKPLLTYRIHTGNTIGEGVLRVKIEWAATVAFFVHGLWKHPKDWDYYAKLTEITDRHTLTRLLMFFFAFFQSLPSNELACDAFIRDEAFTRFIYREVR
jgi:glycosyltransferase involved in cell wall biosynthesis